MQRGELDFADELGEARGYMPYQLDLFDDSSNFRTKYKLFFERVQALGAFTTKYLKRCADEDDAYDAAFDPDEPESSIMTTFLATDYEQELLKGIFAAWQKAFIIGMESMREIRHQTLKKEEFGVGPDGKQRKIKNTLGMHVFFELTRLYGLIHRSALLDEQNNITTIPLEDLTTDDYVMMLSLSKTRHPLWISCVNTFDISSLYETKEDPDAEVEAFLVKIKGMWTKPIMHFTQSELYLVIFFLTQQLNDIPTMTTMCLDPASGQEVRVSVLDEYRCIFHAVWLRAGYLMQELHGIEVMDMGDDPIMRQEVLKGQYSFHRNFATFCSFYLGEIMRRFFYLDELANNRLVDRYLREATIKTLGVATFEWVATIVDSFADEAFEDLYHGVNAEGYQFVGDDGWFKFLWPQKIHSRGACITAFRPHLYKRFYSETMLSKRAVLIAARAGNYVAKLFVFKAIDEYVKIRVPNVHWTNAVVIANPGIEMSTYKLTTDLAPMLLQVFSSYWPYDKGRVVVCDDIYEGVGVWFWLLMTRYKCTLFDRDLKEIVKQVVPKSLFVEPGQMVHHASSSLASEGEFDFAPVTAEDGELDFEL